MASMSPPIFHLCASKKVNLRQKSAINQKISELGQKYSKTDTHI